MVAVMFLRIFGGRFCNELGGGGDSSIVAVVAVVAVVFWRTFLQ